MSAYNIEIPVELANVFDSLTLTTKGDIIVLWKEPKRDIKIKDSVGSIFFSPLILLDSRYISIQPQQYSGC